MAYYNYAYPAGYQPVNTPGAITTAWNQPPYGSQTPVPPPQNNGIIWVQGEAGAKSYLVAPNTTVQLWDSEDQVIYLKSADVSGMPSMRILDYKERVAEIPAIEAKDNEFKEMQNQINFMKSEIADIWTRLGEEDK